MHSGVMVADDDDRPVPPRELGEILVAGPQVMAGYWNQPEESGRTERNGWLHTGDIGRLVDEGYLYVVDRMNDMLISGGLSVYPAEIERLLAALPGITEVAVIGVRDEPLPRNMSAKVQKRELLAEYRDLASNTPPIR